MATSGGSKGAAPYDPKFSQFHKVFGKIRQNRMLAPPPMGHPGSASGSLQGGIRLGSQISAGLWRRFIKKGT